MAKTKTVKRKAWGVFNKRGRLLRSFSQGSSYPQVLHYCVAELQKEAKRWAGETVRPVTISWKVEE